MKRVPAPITIVTETTTASASVASSDDDDDDENKHYSSGKQQVSNSKRNSNKFPYSTALPSPHGSAHSFDIQVRLFFMLFKSFYELFN